MSMTDDGFVAGPKGESDWLFANSDPSADQWSVKTAWQAGAHLMGSKSFHDMAGWWPSSTEIFAPPMNPIPKVVFSKDPDVTAKSRWTKVEANGDGKISADEHAAGAKKMFEGMDADKDGKVTPAEMDAAHERMGKMMGKAHKPGHAEMSAADKMKVVDSNHDGVLTADEHVAGAKMMFDKMDTDKDGYLSKSEMEAGHARMMSKMSAKGSDKPSADAPTK